VLPVSDNGLGISRGFTVFPNKWRRSWRWCVWLF